MLEFLLLEEWGDDSDSKWGSRLHQGLETDSNWTAFTNRLRYWGPGLILCNRRLISSHLEWKRCYCIDAYRTSTEESDIQSKTNLGGSHQYLSVISYAILLGSGGVYLTVCSQIHLRPYAGQNGCVWRAQCFIYICFPLCYLDFQDEGLFICGLLSSHFSHRLTSTGTYQFELFNLHK